mgnify:CR=1 FL=1
MHRWLLDLLICPDCSGEIPLAVNSGNWEGERLEDGVLGFRVESLPKLKDFRATAVRGVSLVHVLIAHLGHPKLQDDKLFEVSALTKGVERVFRCCLWALHA